MDAETILRLTRKKTMQMAFTLNEELIELFKQACEKNDVKPTQMLESWIIDYIDRNKLI